MKDRNRSKGPGYLQLVLFLGTLSWAWGMHTIWIEHDVAGLAVLGLDYLTYIKLLPREDFPNWQRAAIVWSWPLAAASILGSQLAWGKAWLQQSPAVLMWVSRSFMAFVSGYLALQILPLDWSPRNLFVDSNLVQTISFLICGGFILWAPLTGLWLMQRWQYWLPVAALGCLPAVALSQFVFLPYFRILYRQDLMSGAGPFFVIAASVLVLVTSLFQHRQARLDRS